MTAKEKMAKALAKRTALLPENGLSESQFEFGWNDSSETTALAKKEYEADVDVVLTALISHLKAGAPKLEEAYENGFNAALVPGIPLGEAVADARRAGLIAFLEQVKGEK